MFNFLSGKLVEKHPTRIVLLCGGIGYEVSIPLSTYTELNDVDSEIKIKTHLHIREDNWQLFGFCSDEEKEMFKLLISISGIGPKVALNVLSGIGIDQFKQSLVDKNVVALTAIPGIGKKTAERIIIELKEKVKVAPGKSDSNVSEEYGSDPIYDDAVMALISLGYKKNDSQKAIDKALKKMPENNIVMEDLIRTALNCV